MYSIGEPISALLRCKRLDFFFVDLSRARRSL